jgi:hypothetical protein
MDKNGLVLLVGTITFLLIIWNLLISVRMTEELKKRGIKANIAHRRGLIFKFLSIYREVTIKEDGKTGPLYNQFILSFSLFSVSLIIGIILSA